MYMLYICLYKHVVCMNIYVHEISDKSHLVELLWSVRVVTMDGRDMACYLSFQCH